MKTKNNEGVLFPNEKEHDKQPDFTGNIVVEGKGKRISAWKNKAKESGKPYIKILVSDFQKEGFKKEDKPKKESSFWGDESDNDIPV